MKTRNMDAPRRTLRRTLGMGCGAGVLALLGLGAQAQLVNYGEQLGAYKDMASSGETIPEPLSERTFSGTFNVRIGEHLHRDRKYATSTYHRSALHEWR